MSGVFGDGGLTTGLAILLGLLLLVVVFSGRLSPRIRNVIAGCGLALAVVALVWAALASVARGDWFGVAFFVIVLALTGWRMARAYRKQSARLAREVE